jgi:RHS repeat-associated protein
MVTTDTFTYTNQDRLALHVHQIDGGDLQLLASNTYDALGQLTSKKVGGSATAYTSLQKVDYQYNIRGWLQSINDVTGLISTDLENRDDLFAFKISYNTPTDNNKALFNGNISETYWKTYNDNQLRKYEYSYDHLNRLLQADYSRPDNKNIKNAYKEALTYDKNGNIKTLNRNSYEDESYEYEVDNLVYVYDATNKNQLTKVTDYSAWTDGFHEEGDPNGYSANDTTDYEYDGFGNMLSDENKGISDIKYNHLNLPLAITFLNNMNKNTKIEYLYDATGKKVGKKVHYFEAYYTPGGGGGEGMRGAAPVSTNSLTGGAMHMQTMDQTDYLAGGYQYKNSVLEFFPHAEGFVKWVEGSPQYYFNYTDHLGNVRVTYYDKGDGPVIAEESNYYPFGLQHKGYNEPEQFEKNWGIVTTFASSLNNKYKYNGKEFQDELGLNVYDYGWRNYSPDIARWTQMDPLLNDLKFTFDDSKTDEEDEEDVAEAIMTKLEIADGVFNVNNLNPYGYGYNNPVSFDDPDGRCPWCIIPIVVMLLASEPAMAPTHDRKDGQRMADAKNDKVDWMTNAIPGGGLRNATGGAILRATVKNEVKNTVKEQVKKTVEKANNTRNPHGAKGKPDHQAKVKELEKKATKENPGKDIVTEKKIKVEGSNRRPDVQVVDPKTGKTTKVYEAERKPNSTRNKNREAEYKRLNIPSETHKVGN